MLQSRLIRGLFRFSVWRQQPSAPAPAPEAPPSATECAGGYGRSPRISGGTRFARLVLCAAVRRPLFPDPAHIDRAGDTGLRQPVSGGDDQGVLRAPTSRARPRPMARNTKTCRMLSSIARRPSTTAAAMAVRLMDWRRSTRGDDPTLRAGDLIATSEGLVRSTGARQAYGQAGEDVTSRSARVDSSMRRLNRHAALGRRDYYSRQQRDAVVLTRALRPLPAPATARWSAPATRSRTDAPGRGKPWSCGVSMMKSAAGSPGPVSFGRMPA